MTGWLDRLGAALLDASLAATAITGLVVLAMLQCRQPARRRVWARTGLLSTLALLPLAALNPVPRFDLRGPLRSLFSNLPDDPPKWIMTEKSATPDGATGLPPVNCAEEPPPQHSRFHRFSRGVVVLYLAGVAIGLGWIGLGLAGTSLLTRRGTIPSALTLQLYSSLPVRGGMIRPRLLVSERATRPVLVGSIRPTILIPHDLDEPGSSDRLRLSLLHELAHLENRDHLFSTAATLTQSIWFFLPTFWWIRDQMKLDQEFLADRRAVSCFGSSGDYASSLIDLAALRLSDHEVCTPTTLDQAPFAVPSMASALFQRVQMLLKCPFPIEGESPLWWRWSTVLTLTLATLAASCLTIRGLSGWAESSPLIPSDAIHSVRLSPLVIAPRAHQGGAFDLRYRLPNEFTLTLEVMAEPVDLPQLEILGHRLGTPSGQEAERQVYRLWHRVRIQRLQGFDFLEVDGQSILAEVLPKPPARWLTIRPLPGQPTRIRDILIEWQH